MPPASSHSRGGGLPCARLERDGLGDEGGEREAREQGVAERAARGDRVEGARGVDDRVGELDAEEASVMRHQLQRVGVEHRAVDAQPHVAVARRRRRSRSRRRTRTPSPTRARAGPARPPPRTARAPPRASAAARRRRPRSDASSSSLQQFRDEPVVADRAVVGRDARVAQQRRALGVRGVAEPEQHAARRQRVLPDRQRRDPDAAADQQRAPADLRPAEADARAARAATARRRRAARTAGACPGRRPRTGSRAVPSSWRRSTENARGRNGRSSAPPPQRSLAVSM